MTVSDDDDDDITTLYGIYLYISQLFLIEFVYDTYIICNNKISLLIFGMLSNTHILLFI